MVVSGIEELENRVGGLGIKKEKIEGIEGFKIK